MILFVLFLLGVMLLLEKLVSEVFFDICFQCFYDIKDVVGNSLLVVEMEVELDDQGDIVCFCVIGNKVVVEVSVMVFNCSFYLVFIIFGVGSLLVNVFVIFIGLWLFDCVCNVFENIWIGCVEWLEGWFLSEIWLLVNEVNVLIDNNWCIIECVCMQVGNFVYLFKMLIVVFFNEVCVMMQVYGILVIQQVEVMQLQV